MYKITKTILKITKNVFADGFIMQVGLFALKGLKLNIAFKTMIIKKQTIINKATKI
jgi:hypothetical protein